MLKLLLVLASLQLADCNCPNGYVLVRDGECRGNAASSVSFFNDEATDAAVAACAQVQAQVAIVHDEEHQSYWKEKEYWNLVLGLVCNASTKRWEWIDGSALAYKPPSGKLDQDCQAGCVWFIADSKSWNHKCDHDSNKFDFWCSTNVIKPEEKECDNFDNDSEDSACYQIGKEAENWQDAQMECRNYGANLASIHNVQENSFIRRLAVSKGAVNGLYLGGTLSGKGKTGFGWIDGTDWDYDNFYPGFPVDGLGDCLFLDTFGTTGQWMNTDCDSKLAVACVRDPKTSYQDNCSSGPWKEGQIIYTPGYPYDATIPCDYFLTVDAGSRIEVTIQTVQANTCCDHLLISDDMFGGNVLANLTGEIAGQNYYSSSNFMRISWNPFNGVGVRGAMFTFRAV